MFCCLENSEDRYTVLFTTVQPVHHGMIRVTESINSENYRTAKQQCKDTRFKAFCPSDQSKIRYVCLTSSGVAAYFFVISRLILEGLQTAQQSKQDSGEETNSKDHTTTYLIPQSCILQPEYVSHQENRWCVYVYSYCICEKEDSHRQKDEKL